MRAFLASHSRIAIPSVGSNMWTYFYDRFGDLSEPANLERCLDAMMHYKHVVFMNPDPARIKAEFNDGDLTYARLFSLFLLHFAEREGKPRWGAQTGLIERYAKEMFSAYPGLKIIHMVRDPRDRYEASISKWPKGKLRAGGATARFIYSMRLADRHTRDHPDGYLVVRFEDLIRQPQTTVERVCDFLGERFEPAMMDLPGAAKMRAELRDGRDEGEPMLSEAFIGRHEGRIPRAEQAFIQLHAGQRMKRLGYEPTALGFDLGERLRFAILDWPGQFARMTLWLAVEFGQQRFPRLVPRKYGARMFVESPTERV